MLLSFLVAAVAADVPVSPSGWEFDTTSPLCSIRQSDGTDKSIELVQTPGNEETEVTIRLPRDTKLPRGIFESGLIELFPTGQVNADILVFNDQDKMLEVHAAVPDAAFADQLSRSAAIGLTHKAIGSVRIAIHSASAAMNALHACEDRKMQAWGIDPVRWRALKVRPVPIGDARSRFQALDYPSDALAADVEEDAIVRLNVGIDGSVTNCSAVGTLKYKSFERAACRVMTGARFHPAEDANGTPVPAPYVYDVIFRIGS